MIAPAPTPQNTYEPRGGARKLFSCRDRKILMDGPSRTGKTRALLEKAYAVASKYAKCRVLLCRKTRSSMNETVLQTFEDHVLMPGWRSWGGEAHRKTRESYNLPNGSSIVLGGMDHTDKIMSSEFDLIFTFESTELTEEDIDKLTTRLSSYVVPYQQLVMDCNPKGPTHHLKRAADAGKLTRIPSTHKDNPRWWDGKNWTKQGVEYLSNLDQMTGHRLQRLRYGRWVQADNVVYPEFDEAIHVIDEMPKGWERWPKRRSIDFGYSDPFVCQWWAGYDDCWYLYREIYHSGRVISAPSGPCHANQILELSAGESYVVTIADHDKEDRETLHRHGIDTSPADKIITVGIDEVKSRLLLRPNGKPRLYFLRGCTVERDPILAEANRPTSTLEEFDAYCWKQNKDSQAKDEPVDAHNHGMDAMRYLVMCLKSGGTYISSVGFGADTDDERGWV